MVVECRSHVRTLAAVVLRAPRGHGVITTVVERCSHIRTAIVAVVMVPHGHGKSATLVERCSHVRTPAAVGTAKTDGGEWRSRSRSLSRGTVGQPERLEWTDGPSKDSADGLGGPARCDGSRLLGSR